MAQSRPLGLNPKQGQTTLNYAIPEELGKAQRFQENQLVELNALKAEAKRRAKKTLGFAIMGADRHAGALSLAKQGAAAAGVADLVTFEVADAKDWKPRVAPAAVFANPPYGERLGEGEDLVESWKSLGNFLHRCAGASAFVLSGNPELTKFLGLRAEKKWIVMNGPIECRLLKYDVRARK